MQTKIISIRISPDLDRHLRIEAAKRDLDRSAFIRKTLTEKLVELMGKQILAINDENSIKGGMMS